MMYLSVMLFDAALCDRPVWWTWRRMMAMTVEIWRRSS